MFLKVKPMLGLVTVLAISVACQKNESRPQKPEPADAPVVVHSSDAPIQFESQQTYKWAEKSSAELAAGISCSTTAFNIDPRLKTGIKAQYKRPTESSNIHTGTQTETQTLTDVTAQSYSLAIQNNSTGTFKGSPFSLKWGYTLTKTCAETGGSCTSDVSGDYSDPIPDYIKNDPEVKNLNKFSGCNWTSTGPDLSKDTYEVGVVTLNGKNLKALKST